MKKHIAIAAALAGLGVAAAWAQGPTVSTGVYTDAQAARGAAVYAGNHCVMCHGPQLTGSDSVPPLAGNIFLANWVGQSLGDLATRIHTTMPQDNPGSLSDPQVADVVAYILQQNKYKTGAKELPPDNAGQSAIILDDKP
jgi:S-disulfanyl-L-cysteine oxidoreductase SoxD